jgi:hypothetical protein
VDDAEFGFTVADQVNTGCFVFRHPDSFDFALTRACCPNQFQAAPFETGSGLFLKPMILCFNATAAMLEIAMSR